MKRTFSRSACALLTGLALLSLALAGCGHSQAQDRGSQIKAMQGSPMPPEFARQHAQQLSAQTTAQKAAAAHAQQKGQPR